MITAFNADTQGVQRCSYSERCIFLRCVHLRTWLLVNVTLTRVNRAFVCVLPPGRMGAHQCEGELSGGSPRTPPSSHRTPAASNTSERERRGRVSARPSLPPPPARFVPGPTFLSSDPSHRPPSLHGKGMHNHTTEFLLCFLVGFDS